MTRARERAPRVVIWASRLPGIRSVRGRRLLLWRFSARSSAGFP